jgi:seryl-tRNA synthetase
VIDLRILRDDPDLVRASQLARGADPSAVDRLLAADAARRAAVATGDSLRAEQKSFGRTIGKASPADRLALLERGKAMAAGVKDVEAAEAAANQELSAARSGPPSSCRSAVPIRRRSGHTVRQLPGRLTPGSDPDESYDPGHLESRKSIGPPICIGVRDRHVGIDQSTRPYERRPIHIRGRPHHADLRGKRSKNESVPERPCRAAV